MLNWYQHLVNVFSAFGRHTFHPRPQDGVFRCDLNKPRRRRTPEMKNRLIEMTLLRLKPNPPQMKKHREALSSFLPYHNNSDTDNSSIHSHFGGC